MIGNHLIADHGWMALMPALRARPVRLTAAQRRRLKKIARGTRARTGTGCGRRSCWTQPAATPTPRSPAARHVSVDTVRKWRGRFADEGMAGLADRAPLRPPARFTRGAGRRGQGAGLRAARRDRDAAVAVVAARSWPARPSPRASPSRSPPSTVRRWLADDALKPWQYRSWIFIRDPDFAAKAARVLDLYARHLGRRAARRGRVRDLRGREDLHPGPLPLPPHPATRAGPARCASNHDYDRGGALAYLAAYDVHRAKVFGRCEPTTGIDPFMRLVAQVMTTEPYAQRQSGVLDRGQRLLPPRPEPPIDRLRQGVARPRSWSTPRSTPPG